MRSAGATLGAALGAWLALLAAIAVQITNPWFLNAPGLYLAVISLPLAALGAVSGALLPRRGGPAQRRRALASLSLALLLVPLVALAWPRPAPSGRVRLLVYGIDGATFDLIDPLAGELPTLSRLQAEGVSATLRSMEPLFSPLLWTTLATGKPPEEHGVRGFRVHATDCRAARFWDVMEAAGLRVGTWKWLVTWPPSQLSAFQVPAWLAPEPDTWPPELSFVKEIELSRRMARKRVEARRPQAQLALDGVQQGLRFSTLVSAARLALRQRLAPDPQRDFLEGQILRVWMDRDAAVAALHRLDPEVLTFTDYATDAIPHRFWRFHEPDAFPGTDPAQVARFGPAVRRAYQQADAVLAELIDEVGPRARVVVISDHGFQAMSGQGHGSLLAPRTERLRERLVAEVGPVDVSRLGHKLVVALTGPDPEGQRAAVIRWVEGMRVASTGRPLYRVEEVPGSASSVGLAVVEEGLSQEGLEREVVGGEPLHLYLSRGEAFSGDHHDRGIFLASGPGIAAGTKLQEVQLLDVAPTLLALVGLPKAADMRGAVPEGLWEGPPPVLGEEPASYDSLVGRRVFVGGASDEQEVNEEQLRALGYIE